MKTTGLMILVSMNLLLPIYGYAKPLSEMKLNFYSQNKSGLTSKERPLKIIEEASVIENIITTEETSIIDSGLMWSSARSLDDSDRATYDSYSTKTDFYLEVQPVKKLESP